MFFPNSPKGAKMRRLTPLGAMRAPFSAMKSPFCALLTPFCALLRFWDKLRFSAVFRLELDKKIYKIIFFKPNFLIINIYAGNIKFTNNMYLDFKNIILLRKIEFDQY
jgi:hypothetical protein